MIKKDESGEVIITLPHKELLTVLKMSLAMARDIGDNKALLLIEKIGELDYTFKEL